MARVQEKASLEELVESVGLGEHWRCRALHEGFVILALAGDAGDFAIEGSDRGRGPARPSGGGRWEADAEDDGQKARMPEPMRRRLRAGPRSAKGGWRD